VLKRVDLAGGIGIEVVRSRVHLESLLQTAVFRGREVLLQAFVPGQTEYVTHCVCKDGSILWSCSFVWTLGPEAFGIPVFGDTTSLTASCRTLSDIARILAPLRYSGPCCVNYKLLPNGEIAIFEINPRLGGSLMNPRNIEFLRQAMAHIIYNAA
jgi:carbamoylphosphate synthase large subunit